MKPSMPTTPALAQAMADIDPRLVAQVVPGAGGYTAHLASREGCASLRAGLRLCASKREGIASETAAWKWLGEMSRAWAKGNP